MPSADREQYYGDPDFTDVPLEGLLSKDYASSRRELIDNGQASLDQRPGNPRTGAALLEGEDIFAARNWGPGTVYVAVIDNERNMASFTPSGAWIPSSPVIDGLGFPLGTPGADLLPGCKASERLGAGETPAYHPDADPGHAGRKPLYGFWHAGWRPAGSVDAPVLSGCS